MIESPLISVIVPVYKVERYLPRCIESILQQTYTNFELILVDDGTPDRSGIICDRYAQKDSRIKVIHKENGGVSTARNAGIDVAQGEWITFVDSDDWISNDYLEVLLVPLEQANYDLIVGSLELRSINVVASKVNVGDIEFKKMTQDEILDIVNKMEFCGPCHKLFKKKILNDYNVKFMDNIAINEDTIFVNNFLSHCNRVHNTGRNIYYYNQLNDSSITKTYPYFDQRFEWDNEYIKSYFKMLESVGVNAIILRNVIINKALDVFCTNIRTIIVTLPIEKAKKKIAEVVKHYTIFSIEDDNCVLVAHNEKRRQLIRDIRVQDIDAIYKALNYKKQNGVRSLLKRLIKIIVRPYLEYYRDHLKIYRF